MNNMDDFANYNKDKLTINLVFANIFSFILVIPIILIYGVPYILIWGLDFLKGFSFSNIFGGALMLILIMIVGIVLHELIHGLVWARYAKNHFGSIKFGILKEMMTPYCHCKEPLKVKHYIMGAIMPAIILGFIPAILSIIIGSPLLLIFGIFFTLGAAGDFLIINLLRKENMNDYAQDHPSEAGCYIFRKNK